MLANIPENVRERISFSKEGKDAQTSSEASLKNMEGVLDRVTNFCSNCRE